MTFTGDVAVVEIPDEAPTCEELLFRPWFSPLRNVSDTVEAARDSALRELRDGILSVDVDCDIVGVL
jgi:hypothetical protein